MTTNKLKLIAIISMFIDHIGAAIIEMVPSLYSQYSLICTILRSIGRISFPIFAFLIVEGFIHTKDFKKYLLRLGVFAILSEIPFDLAFYGKFFYLQYQNVIFTFFIAVLMLYFIKKYANTGLKTLIIIISAGVISSILFTDYAFIGTSLIAVFYLYRDRGIQKYIYSSFIIFLNPFTVLSFIPLYFYNGRKGQCNLKYLIYIFYPLHLLLLFLFRKYYLGY